MKGSWRKEKVAMKDHGGYGKDKTKKIKPFSPKHKKSKQTHGGGKRNKPHLGGKQSKKMIEKSNLDPMMKHPGKPQTNRADAALHDLLNGSGQKGDS